MIRPLSKIFRFAAKAPAEKASAPRRLWRDRSGATAVTFAMILLPTVVALGGGMDIFAMWKRQVDLQSSVDGAVMNGAIKADEGGSTGVVQTAVKDYVTKTFDTPFKANTTLTTTVDSNLGQVGTSAVSKMDTTFLKIIGISTLTLTAKAAATYGGGLLEVALAIDVTGSMEGAKLTAAKAAAKDLVQTLYTVPGTNKVNDKVRMGLVPFARYVNIGTSHRGQSWLDVSAEKKWKQYDCWDTWPGGYCKKWVHKTGTCYNDGTPYTCSWDDCQEWADVPTVKVCAWNNYETKWYGCVGSRTYPADLQAEATSASKVPGLMDTWCNAELVRLTKVQGNMISAIENLSAYEETYIAPGMLWAWRVLSSKQPFADGSADSIKTKKAIILMTDGANTVSSTAPGHWGNDVADSNATLTKTCTNVKADGIAIYTIAFQVTDPTIKSILTNCASNSSYFFDSTNVSQMQSAFKQIGSQLSSRRLVY